MLEETTDEREGQDSSFDTSEIYLGRQLPLEALTIGAVLCTQSVLYCSCKASVGRGK